MNKMKYSSKLWFIPLLLVMLMTSCDERVGITSPPITTIPTVSSTNPANTLTGVALNQKITATFSEEMNSSSITTASFTLMQGTSFVSGTVSYTGTTATFSPSSNLMPNTTYIATITTLAKSKADNALTSNYVWSFTTGLTAAIIPPSVNSTDPPNAAVNVPINQKIAATFSVAMDASTITASTFTLTQGTIPISGFVSYSGTTAIFAPSINLTPNTAYTVTITTGAKDLTGISLENKYVWSFTTGAEVAVTPPTIISTDPIFAGIDIALNQKISATFSKTMDATTITTATFTLMQGSTFVSGTVSYIGTTAIYIPTSNLVLNTTYTATITTGAKDLAGNSMTSNYVWSFTTGAAAIVTPPLVISTDPNNTATNVSLNQKITATFDKTMDASTITTATFTLMQGTSFVSGTVSYTGTTATFTPSSNLISGTTYVATITTGAKDLAGNSLVLNHVWSFTTGAAVVITPPTVILTNPVNNEIGVALNQKISATFSRTMDASTITTATFTLKQGTTSVAGFVSYTGITGTFAPSVNLLPNTIYTATITTGAKDLSGNYIESNHVWNFTTGAAVVITPPTVISTDPVNAAINVALNQKIAATFSKTMDASTITTATYTLKQGTTSIPGFVSYSGTTATFAPTNNLLPNTTYTATITTGAKDLSGNALANQFVWVFTTGAAIIITPPVVNSTDPVNNEIDVALNQKIAATFSKTMDASTITTATFTILQGTTPVSGFVSYSGSTATFSSASNFLPNTKYTATITTGAKDLAGNALVNNYVWSFTTGAAIIVTPPTVTLTDPLNNATGVALNQKIAATFSKSMDATTITTATYNLKQGTTSIAGFVSYSGTTAIFAPAVNLLPNTLYSVTITTGAKDLSGNALVNNYVWSFTTGAAVIVTPPTVLSTVPVDLAINVSLNQKVSATFSKTMDASTITTATFTLMQGTTFVSGTVSYLGATASYTPSSNLMPNTVYTATITTGAKDLSGNALVTNYVWSFSTGAAVIVIPPVVLSTIPVNAAIGVSLNQKVSATFSKIMDASTLTTATFTLMQGSTFVSGTVSYTGTTASYTPSSNLMPNTVYTATITTGAKDLAGVALANNYVWSFTTVVPNTITLSSNPAAGGTTSGGGTFNPGTSITVTATPNIGFTFVNWKEGANIVSTNANYQFTVNANRILVANFIAIQYLVTLSSNPALGGTTSGGGTFDSGSSVTVNAVPNLGYTFTNWTENGTSVSTNASYTFIIDGNKTLVAHFSIIQFTVLLSSIPAAGGTTSGEGSFNPGSSVTVTATPNIGYSFTNWTKNGVIASTNASYTFTINANTTLVANFASTGPVIYLGTAATFGSFGGSAGITNQGIFTQINGDIGTTAASTLVTGFHDTGGNVYTQTPLNMGTVNGTIFCAPPAPGTAPNFAIAQQALADATAAFNYLAGLPGGSDPGAGELGGLVLAPGTYTSASGTFKITSSDLTLDAQNNPNAIFVFQMAQSLTVGGPGLPRSIILVNGAQAKNVFWQVGSAATINGTGGGTMVGTIIAYSGVTFSTAGNVILTTLNGRALSLNASVTMVNTIINVPSKK